MNTAKNLSIKGGKEIKEYSEAIFAGGCFWCMEGIFEARYGVKEAIAGYAGGDEKTANYKDVSSGLTKHKEAVKVIYDPDIVSYDTLVNIFWTQIDPTDPNGQFADIGPQYQTAIFYKNNLEKSIAEKSKKDLDDSNKFDKKIATQILPFTTFFPAEDFHQDYYKKSPFLYNQYKKGSGREDFIHKTWEIKDLKQKLTPLEFKVTQEGGTEPPFENAYWDNHEEGIYVDVVDGTPLFSSTDKFDSGTGWPSFSKPIDDNLIGEKEDYKLSSQRTEVVSVNTESHLGHVFDDGPKELGGMRYCINSAALKFISKEDMKELGYEKYLFLFNKI